MHILPGFYLFFSLYHAHTCLKIHHGLLYEIKNYKCITILIIIYYSLNYHSYNGGLKYIFCFTIINSSEMNTITWIFLLTFCYSLMHITVVYIVVHVLFQEAGFRNWAWFPLLLTKRAKNDSHNVQVGWK